MPHQENDPRRRRRSGDIPTGGVPLPPELAEYLRTADLGAMLSGSDHGSLYLIKAPSAEIATPRGSFPIRLPHELYSHP